MSTITDRYTKVEPGVRKVLEVSPEARNSNIVCVLLYWRLVRPFVGHILRATLRQIRTDATMRDSRKIDD